MRNTKTYVSAAILTVFGILSIAVGLTVAHAETERRNGPMLPAGWEGGHGFVGAVTAVNGTSLTLAPKMMEREGAAASTTTYTVDAKSATIRKGNATGTVALIAVGDMIMVRGTASGTTVTASAIFDNGTSTPAMRPEGPEKKSGFFGSIGNFFKGIFGWGR